MLNPIETLIPLGHRLIELKKSEKIAQFFPSQTQNFWRERLEKFEFLQNKGHPNTHIYYRNN